MLLMVKADVPGAHGLTVGASHPRRWSAHFSLNMLPRGSHLASQFRTTVVLLRCCARDWKVV